MQNELFDGLDKLLTGADVPTKIRAAMDSPDFNPLWQPLQESGYLDVLLPQTQGGAGLGWREAWEVLFACGRHGLPVPVGSTLFGRALLAELGQPCPVGPLSGSGFGWRDTAGSLVVRDLPAAMLASHALVQDQDAVYLLPLSAATLTSTGGKGSFDAQASWDRDVVDESLVGTADKGLLRHGLALALAVELAGVADRVLSLTLKYASDREQFGKPIGKFQALQQQISEMAERVYGARMASQIGCQTESWRPVLLAAAVAKAQTSAVAPRIAAIAHAVHAAIGVTFEYDLQLYTRRLYEWARVGGGADYWAREVGQAAMSEPDLLGFMRQRVFQEA